MARRRERAGAAYNRTVTRAELRGLPSVEAVLSALRTDGEAPHALALAAARSAIARARQAALDGTPPTLEAIVAETRAVAAGAERPSLRRVINATGVVLQTNLGRAPLSERAVAAMAAVARGYSNLEYDLEAGSRGSRHEHVRDLIRKATGAADGLVVNNNAAALFMVLSVLTGGREVVISRGQAVEIGGGFRIPDVMRQSGARLVEVGTTNRTYVRDYADAIGPETAALLRVHSSNFRVVGFTAEAPLAELAALARERGVLLLDDLGSGCLLDTAKYGMAHEPTVQESLAAGVNLAFFSGDKLLGGPQCGVIAGDAALVAELRAHPLARALRVDRLTIAALNATLQAYVAGTAEAEVPVWRMIALREAGLKRRAGHWARQAGVSGRVVRSESMVGGGSLPGQGLPTWCAAVTGPAGADALSRALRACDPPVVARIEDGAVLLDPRTVDPADDAFVRGAIARLVLTQ